MLQSTPFALYIPILPALPAPLTREQEITNSMLEIKSQIKLNLDRKAIIEHSIHILQSRLTTLITSLDSLKLQYQDLDKELSFLDGRYTIIPKRKPSNTKPTGFSRMTKTQIQELTTKLSSMMEGGN